MDKVKLDEFIETQIISSAQKLKGKFPPISEMVNNTLKILEIEKIYLYISENKTLYLFKLKNYNKTPKYRFFISIVLADVSSDLLVSIAKEFALKHGIKLIQYNLSPKLSRISLIALKELREAKGYGDLIKRLESFKQIFQKKINRLIDLIK